MNDNIFGQVDGLFNESEAWGDWQKVSGLLILTLYHLRKVIGFPLTIHGAFATSGHAEKSAHYTGEAVDFHVKGLAYDEAIRRMEAALVTLNITDRVGLGIYPDWNQPGFHLDIRGFQARWGRLGPSYVAYAVARAKVMKAASDARA